ncbi:seed specific protein Bn15D1B [Iris pallida]|uniref:Seed specific protein Bn15D1B n=1 Tax=Iris pallida TaxID=29817 RepID=A0AAX6H059_IRIPA|nr:seed specific protein Bn15D1B [Iris pallida]
MAANLCKGRAVAASFGNRVASRVCKRNYSKDPNPLASGVGHYSTSYDKNVEEEVRPAVVPDHVIGAKEDAKYWGPNPHTGVFGPAAEGSGAHLDLGRPPAAGGSGAGPSVLDQTAWFRPLEDVEKPPPA